MYKSVINTSIVVTPRQYISIRFRHSALVTTLMCQKDTETGVTFDLGKWQNHVLLFSLTFCDSSQDVNVVMEM